MAASMATRKRNTSARYVTHYAILHAMLTLQLLYIYILGWNVDFGHLEAVNLISATKYSEKQIGYLAVTLFLHEEHELIHLVVNSIRKDLLDHNELNNCLALHAIANVGGKELGEALSAEVHRLLISPLVVIERGQWLS
jgi:AP-2 complex subunit alpha